MRLQDATGCLRCFAVRLPVREQSVLRYDTMQVGRAGCHGWDGSKGCHVAAQVSCSIRNVVSWSDGFRLTSGPPLGTLVITWFGLAEAEAVAGAAAVSAPWFRRSDCGEGSAITSAKILGATSLSAFNM